MQILVDVVDCEAPAIAALHVIVIHGSEERAHAIHVVVVRERRQRAGEKAAVDCCGNELIIARGINCHIVSRIVSRIRVT